MWRSRQNVAKQRSEHRPTCAPLDGAPAPSSSVLVAVAVTAAGAVVEMDTVCFVVGPAFKSEATFIFFFCVCCLGVVDVDVVVVVDFLVRIVIVGMGGLNDKAYKPCRYPTLIMWRSFCIMVASCALLDKAIAAGADFLFPPLLLDATTVPMLLLVVVTVVVLGEFIETSSLQLLLLLLRL